MRPRPLRDNHIETRDIIHPSKSASASACETGFPRIGADAAFLASQALMDYSLLVGIRLPPGSGERLLLRLALLLRRLVDVPK